MYTGCWVSSTDVISKRSVGRDASQKLKGVPPGISALKEGGVPERRLKGPLLRAFWRLGNSDKALVASSNVGIRIFKDALEGCVQVT